MVSRGPPQVLQLLKRSRQLIQESDGAYPDNEVEWLLVRSWNIGTHFANLKKNVEAQPWMALAMGLIDTAAEAANATGTQGGRSSV